MNLYLRLFWVWFSARFRSAISNPFLPARLNLRVFPNDLDVFLHLNNGRYLTLMDLGRMDYVLRCGLGRLMRERGWYAVAAAVEIRYLRPVQIARRVTLVTRLADWDNVSFAMEQRFESGGKLCARAFISGQVRRGRERVPPAELWKALGWQVPEAPEGGRLTAEIARRAGNLPSPG